MGITGFRLVQLARQARRIDDSRRVLAGLTVVVRVVCLGPGLVSLALEVPADFPSRDDAGEWLAALADEDDEFVLTLGGAVGMGSPGWCTIDTAASEGLSMTCGVEDATEGRTGPLQPISVVRARGPDMNRQLSNAMGTRL